MRQNNWVELDFGNEVDVRKGGTRFRGTVVGYSLYPKPFGSALVKESGKGIYGKEVLATKRQVQVVNG